jgi:molybdopterin-containing oxidoreductase family membrane subunit
MALRAPADPDTRDEAVILGRQTDAELTDQLLGVVLTPPRWIAPALVVTGAGSVVLFLALGYTVVTGVGVWGNNIPVAWAFAITNFVWWIGIGHAGTFISAFLLLLEQKWRTSINRFSEAMTLFAIVQAGMFPVMHMGRCWFFYWLIPYPSTMQVWPQFRSSLTWDVAAVTTYFSVSLMFWYLGLVPDLAVMRDRAPERWRRRIYGLFALGWSGSSREWNRYRVAYGLLGGFACPLVISVHSIVSMDFAIAQLPGWHSLIFPPYFVAGAIYSGFAMVLTLMLPARRIYRLENVITKRHLDNMGKMLLLTGWIVTYAYLIEDFTAWYSGDTFEIYTSADYAAHAVGRHDLRSDRHVARALHAHRVVGEPRLPAVVLAHVSPFGHRRHDLARDDVLLLVPVPDVPALRAVHSHQRDERDEAKDARRRGRANARRHVARGQGLPCVREPSSSLGRRKRFSPLRTLSARLGSRTSTPSRRTPSPSSTRSLGSAARASRASSSSPRRWGAPSRLESSGGPTPTTIR